MKVSDLNKATTTKKTVTATSKYEPVVVFGDGETWAGLQGCTLLITDHELYALAGEDVVERTGEEHPDDKIYGEYALDLLIRDLPIETLQKYKVVTARAPKPKPVRAKGKT